MNLYTPVFENQTKNFAYILDSTFSILVESNCPMIRHHVVLAELHRALHQRTSLDLRAQAEI